jgi:hypothetical protein
MLAAALFVLPVPAGAANPAVPLTAGSARVDITPAVGTLAPDDTIRDPLYVRAIVARHGAECAVLVGTDQAGLRGTIVQDAVARAAVVTGCPKTSFLISATHTHSGSSGAAGMMGDPSAKRVTDAIVEAVTQAARKLVPVRIAFATHDVDLNVNRDLFDRRGDWRQAANPGGASDKTLAVLSFLNTDGVPVGVYMTYAMHPINFFMTGVISADFPGEASRYVEGSFGAPTVAIFAQGASGNQNPRMLEEPFVASLRTGQGVLRQRAGLTPIPIPPTAPSGKVLDMRTATSAPVAAADQAAYRAAVARNVQWVSAMGTLIGETALELIRGDNDAAPAVGPRLWSGQRSFGCPGRDRQDTDAPARENALPAYKDGADVNLLVSVLRLGDVALVGVNGEVYTEIGQRLKRESPLRKTAMVTLANGSANSGYIYADAAAANRTFQVIGSRLKPGCAEDGIVDTALSLITQSGN